MKSSRRGVVMSARSTTAFNPFRVVALALLALATPGLAYVHFASGDAPVRVPSGAHAGQLTLHPCRYGTTDGSYPADCGTLVVRENRHDPDSRLIALPVTRVRARSATPGAPM